MKQASDCGRSKQNTRIFMRAPPMTPMHSPKSTCAWPGGWASGTKASRDRVRAIRTEFDFKYNHRSALGYNDEVRADALLRGAKGKRLLYRQPDNAAHA